MKHLFFDDYSEGVHPALLEAIVHTNSTQQRGYGEDEYCAQATARIRETFGLPDADVHFLPTGTVTNAVAISAALRPYEGVIAATSAHIAVHEAGAIEATGHKILTMPGENGKLTPDSIRSSVMEFEDEHMVLPRMVEIAQATELGTVYRPAELTALIEEAKRNDLLTFADGARLAMALASPLSAMTASDYGNLGLDMFWIGGVKVGGLLGEALVIVNDDLKKRFRFHIKQHGALAAKGRFFGVQFDRFFEDGLWFELGRASNAGAARLADGLTGLGVQLAYPLETNQLFVVLPTPVMNELQQDWGFYKWAPLPDSPGNEIVRFVSSWATPDDAIDELIADVACKLG